MIPNQSRIAYITSLLSQDGDELSQHQLEFRGRLLERIENIEELYRSLYGNDSASRAHFDELILTLYNAFEARGSELKIRDNEKAKEEHWFLSNELSGMSLYVDRFAENLKGLKTKLPYLEHLGVNLLHLMPIFESPEGESDGGYAVSDFRKIDQRFGNLEDLVTLRKTMQEKGMYLMLDIVLNHTSHLHEWASKAKSGEKDYQDYFYMYDNRWIPNQFEEAMPEIFPESAPGNFTYLEECQSWVMTVFHNYQWDLNFMNPRVFREMLDVILFYANLGVDILRIDAPAFIWKQTGTSCQNLPQAHSLLRLIKQCVEVATPGMALLGEAIVAPKDIIKYFGTGDYTAKECDFAYNATHMALQWDMLATEDTRIMLASQQEILKKPFGTSWINYTRCHDDIGLGYEDSTIRQSGQDPFLHRKYLKEYYSGTLESSPARGALFSSNPKTGDARISGTLASLCGLEKALLENNPTEKLLSIKRILLMQAHSIFLGGLPMLYYGDEVGYTNDYSYQQDHRKSYDNRWMHRPKIDWRKNELWQQSGTVENEIFKGIQQLISIRKKLKHVSDFKNQVWISPHNIHVAGYIRHCGTEKLYCVFNFSSQPAFLTWYAFKEQGDIPEKLYDYWTGQTFVVGPDNEYLILPPYEFHLLEPVG